MRETSRDVDKKLHVNNNLKYGKSNFAINEAHNLAVLNNIPVLYIDTEMQTSTFITRLLAIDTGIPMRDLENFSYKSNSELNKKVESSLKKIKEAPLIHKYSPNWTKDKIRDDVTALKRNLGIEVVIYDYVKVKEAGVGGTQEHNELGNWTIFLKDLAGELNIPIVSMAQMSPYEMRLADSDKINRYASTVGFLLPIPDKTRNKLVQKGCPNTKDYIHIQYNRNGASMSNPDMGVYVDYTRENATFKEAEYQEEVELLSQ